jgi:DNA-binding transcriptional regulator YiaG
MMRPDARLHNQDPEYFRQLVESTGLSAVKLAPIMGHDERTIQRWMKGDRKYPYSAQFLLECLVLSPY